MKTEKKIVDTCASSPETMILITHGTSTMLQTASDLAKDRRLTAKSIVLTGAFKPERFVDSDATFNVGLALGALQMIHAHKNNDIPNVFIAMNGMVYKHDECCQNSAGLYVSNSSSEKDLREEKH